MPPPSSPQTTCQQQRSGPGRRGAVREREFTECQYYRVPWVCDLLGPCSSRCDFLVGRRVAAPRGEARGRKGHAELRCVGAVLLGVSNLPIQRCAIDVRAVVDNVAIAGDTGLSLQS